MSEIEFEPWPKIARLFRDCVITEKLDGTNAAIGFQAVGYGDETRELPVCAWADEPEYGGGSIAVYAQSRKRIVTPASPENKSSDNHGFAAWVRDNAEALYATLGLGRHFGEWWGLGIERGYGLKEKRFSLFNTPRYTKPEFDLTRVEGLGTVPVLYEGPFSTFVVEQVVANLAATGSRASEGFLNPEGVITYHVAAGVAFKTTIEGDEKPKGSNE